MIAAAEHELAGLDVLAGGVRLYVTVHGSGPAVLLVHGPPASGYLWHAVARDLESRARCVMPDLVGLGRSERPRSASAYRLDAQAGALLALIDAWKLDTVVLVGHDLGGAVAVHLTARAPDRVRGLVLLDAPLHPDGAWPPGPLLPWLLPGAARAAALLGGSPGLAARLLGRTLPGSLSTHERQLYLAPLLGRGGARGLAQLVRGVDLAATAAALAQVGVDPPPSLLLWSDGLSYARRVQAALGGSVLVPVPVSRPGGLLPQQRPERVAEEIAAFLAELG